MLFTYVLFDLHVFEFAAMASQSSNPFLIGSGQAGHAAGGLTGFPMHATQNPAGQQRSHSQPQGSATMSASQ